MQLEMGGWEGERLCCFVSSGVSCSVWRKVTYRNAAIDALGAGRLGVLMLGAFSHFSN